MDSFLEVVGKVSSLFFVSFFFFVSFLFIVFLSLN